MPGAQEVWSALFGSWRLLFRDPGALDCFEHDIEAFWRSFAAFLLASPFYLMTIGAGWRLMMESGAPFDGSLTTYTTVQMAGYAAHWALFPLIMVYATRALGLSDRYVSYIIVHNWSSVLAVAVMSPAFLLYNAGAVNSGGLASLTVILLLVALWYVWQVARIALSTSGAVAAGIVGLNLLLSFLIGHVSDGLLFGGV